jgi:hypothetical protein
MSAHKNVALDPLHYAIELVGEEGCEIGHQVNKIFRFGLFDVPPKKGQHNLQLLQNEITDLVATVKILNFELVKAGLPPIDLNDSEGILKKMDKVAHYAMHSLEVGTLSEPLTIMT